MTAPEPLSVLLLYVHAAPEPVRETMRRDLGALAQAGHAVVRWNARYGVPGWIRDGRYDAIVLHYSLLALRNEPWFDRWRPRLDWVAAHPAAVVALPQDDYDGSELLDDWLADLGVGAVLSALAERWWPLVYPRTHALARFERTLTGFAPDRRLRRVRPHDVRPLVATYRARRLPYRFGWLGQLKPRLGAAASEAARRLGAPVDVSTEAGATLYGPRWDALLASGRCALGSESGASALDRRGELRRSEAALRAARPGLTFAEFAAAQPPGWDGYRFSALSPRVLEAARALACPLLVEGEHSDAVEPWTHYLPIREDLSDVDEALERARDARTTEEIARRAFDHLVASGRFSTARLAGQIAALALDARGPRRAPRASLGLRPPAARAHDALVVRLPRRAARALRLARPAG